MVKQPAISVMHAVLQLSQFCCWYVDLPDAGGGGGGYRMLVKHCHCYHDPGGFQCPADCPCDFDDVPVHIHERCWLWLQQQYLAQPVDAALQGA
jgi:hypothetical protein